MLDTGVDSPLGEFLPLAHSVVGGVDVRRLEVPEAARLVEECAEVERLFAALRVVAAATLENTTVWRREGFRSLGAWMASKTGTTVGPANAILEMVGLLDELAALKAAFCEGRLSDLQAREIAEVASEVPDAEEQLLQAADKLSLTGLREECQRIEAAALIDEDERHRRVHKQRRTRAWVRKGEGHFMTPGELARLLAQLDARTNDVVAGGA